MAVHDMLIRIGAKVTPGFADGLKRAFSGFDSLMGGLAGGALLGAPAAGLGLINARMKELAGLQDLSETLNMPVKYLGQLQRVAEISGVSFGVVESALTKLITRASESPDKFAAIGISVWDVNGQMKDMQTLTNEVMTTLNNETDASKRAAMAKAVLGKSWAELLPVIRNYNDEVNKGVPVTQEAAKAADEYEKNLNRIWRGLKERASYVGGGLAGAAAQAGANIFGLPQGQVIGRMLTPEQLAQERSVNMLNNSIQPLSDLSVRPSALDPLLSSVTPAQDVSAFLELARKEKSEALKQIGTGVKAMDATGGW